MFDGAYDNKVVWLSGHTGFKGSWLAEWLVKMGAKVHGFSLPAPTQPALFEQVGLSDRVVSEIGDVRDLASVQRSINAAQPDFVFHLAAQPLVRESYTRPVETYATNVLGTVHVMESLRNLRQPCAAVFITTDKCYENREWVYGYREGDPLGGCDPYSSSKAAAELVIQAYRHSFFEDHPVKIASARAGNVIGGGDWAMDRIVPDCIRHLSRGDVVPVRNPIATRPWQHVLEPLSGYLWLGAVMAGRGRQHLNGVEPCSAFNFGPGNESNRPVSNLVEEVLRHWEGRWETVTSAKAVHEAGLLQLCTDKARQELAWTPVWSFEETVAQTVSWYKQAEVAQQTDAIHNLTLSQIHTYCRQAKLRELPWARG